MRIPFSLCMTLRMCARLYKHIYARTVACTTRIQNDDHTQTTTCKNVQSTSGVFTTSRGDVSRILLDAESLLGDVTTPFHLMATLDPRLSCDIRNYAGTSARNRTPGHFVRATCTRFDSRSLCLHLLSEQ